MTTEYLMREHNRTERHWQYLESALVFCIGVIFILSGIGIALYLRWTMP